MTSFYATKENLRAVLAHYLAIFSEGNAPIVPLIRDANGNIDLEKTMTAPCYQGFPESELRIWRNHWPTAQ